nr:protein LEO1 homolog isoform X1 [Tanacetum cinerariifolium]
MKPEGGDVVEGHGKAEVGSDKDGELQEVGQENLESEGERNQSSQEVTGDQRDERDEKRSEENQSMDNADEEIDQARSQRSPEEEKYETHMFDTSPEIRDVFGESDDEEPADYDAAQTNVEDDTNGIRNVCGASIN